MCVPVCTSSYLQVIKAVINVLFSLSLDVNMFSIVIVLKALKLN